MKETAVNYFTIRDKGIETHHEAILFLPFSPVYESTNITPLG